MPSSVRRNLARLRGLVLFIALILSFSTLYLGTIFLSRPSLSTGAERLRSSHSFSSQDGEDYNPYNIIELIHQFEDFPITSPYKDSFGEVGRRAQVLRTWLDMASKADNQTKKESILDAAESLASSLFPFLQSHQLPSHPLSRTPLSDLRSSIRPGSKGIVIPAGDRNVRFAAHLIRSLRYVLKSELPIEIVYTGDTDLSPENRAFLANLTVDDNKVSTINFLDILTVFDDSTLRMKEGTWAIKAFAALGSSFEAAILVDADSVFLQRPETLFNHTAYQRSGALLFRDRLLWQHASKFRERHEWWRSQITRPSAALNTSLVWTQEYAEEGDSGVVVVDKSRLDVLIGLLHVCWQNSYEVREEVTYRLTYGDKESWWFGFELSGSRYEMEKHYAAIVGWEKRGFWGQSKVCSFVIAHIDENGRLLWYNGSLLKNKQVESMAHEYAVPDKWVVDGKWLKGATKEDMSCMVESEVFDVTELEMQILKLSIAEAKKVDESLFPKEIR